MTHKYFWLKLSNAVLTLECFLNVSNIDGIKHFFQMIHGLCHKNEMYVETNIQT